ncbi:MAG: M15 family metallopeptidase [Geobacteraceae bacterium]|nr:M15 family metallopeptidase [Geobacteraceae bacterium]
MMKKARSWMLCWTVVVLLFSHGVWAGELPKGFVDARTVIPDLRLELRYLGTDNFVGQRVDGYRAERCILTGEAAAALKQVQDDLRPFGLALKVYDAYRPQRAVDHFDRWARALSDTRTKMAFYPDVAKKDLFRLGYIAGRSSHSRGSTVDLTIVVAADGQPGRDLDMGTGFDLFGPASWPASTAVTAEQRAHRLLLRSLMVRHGFVPFDMEWWHFTLAHEPYPATYFDFPVE